MTVTVGPIPPPKLGLWWALGTYHDDGHITLVLAAGSTAAARAIFGDGSKGHLVHECHRSELVREARLKRIGEVWTAKVERTPSIRDKFRGYS